MEHGLELFEYLREKDSPIWVRNQGVDHFLTLSRRAWDFSQSVEIDPPIWGTSFLELPEFYNLTSLIVESRHWAWQELAVPYLTSFHPPSLLHLESWIRRAKGSKRTTLVLFSGGGGIGSTPNIRRSIRDECDNSSIYSSYSSLNNVLKICEWIALLGHCEHDPIRYMRPMLQSTFCLKPPGDVPTRRVTFDGIVAGFIPVFFEEQGARSQYKWHLPVELYEEFVVFIPKEDVVNKGLRILNMFIPRHKVRRVREKVMELMPRVMYRKHGSSMGLRAKMDAFDIAIEDALQRISSRLKGIDFDKL